MRVLVIVAFMLPMAAFCEEPTAPATGLGKPVSSSTLEAQRGGDDVVVNNAIKITGDVTDNTAHNVVTGANSIQDGSFANSSGITSVVQNTGANVLIQSATIVNVQFAP